ncbi:peptidoglycan-binding protein [Streptomyces sp. NPDC001843]|uniref:peptidoglycan-binding domain-containing protein n=1 Tax=Streptomyces sp. NPDC001843 TaxID=3364617 RepID=UPI00368A09B9
MPTDCGATAPPAPRLGDGSARRLEYAVTDQQRACGISADGIVGPDTWRCLRGGDHN